MLRLNRRSVLLEFCWLDTDASASVNPFSAADCNSGKSGDGVFYFVSKVYSHFGFFGLWRYAAIPSLLNFSLTASRTNSARDRSGLALTQSSTCLLIAFGTKAPKSSVFRFFLASFI
jgi:hypothetical protein